MVQRQVVVCTQLRCCGAAVSCCWVCLKGLCGLQAVELLQQMLKLVFSILCRRIAQHKQQTQSSSCTHHQQRRLRKPTTKQEKEKSCHESINAARHATR
jgi:hypothetical protein